jgi:hypothetical protein
MLAMMRFTAICSPLLNNAYDQAAGKTTFLSRLFRQTGNIELRCERLKRRM